MPFIPSPPGPSTTAILMIREVLILAGGALALILASILPACAASDGEFGEKAFWARCSTCHSATEDKNKIGPTLFGVYGRPIGSIRDFDYSDAMTAMGETGARWDDANLTLYLSDPRAFVAGNKMSFQGVKDPEEVARIIAYLKSQRRE